MIILESISDSELHVLEKKYTNEYIISVKSNIDGTFNFYVNKKKSK